MRQELSYGGWTRTDELNLERAACGWLRSSRAGAYVLSHPVSENVSLVNGEIGAGDSMMESALAAIREAKEKYDPGVDKLMAQIREVPVTPPLADASESVRQAVAPLSRADLT